MVEYRWSCEPGKFVDKVTGQEYLTATGKRYLSFNGDEREWRETLVEVMYDVVNTIVKTTVISGSQLDLHASSVVGEMLRSSVLYGRRLGCGLQYDIVGEADPHRLELIDRETGEVMGVLHVLDVP